MGVCVRKGLDLLMLGSGFVLNFCTSNRELGTVAFELPTVGD